MLGGRYIDRLHWRRVLWRAARRAAAARRKLMRGSSFFPGGAYVPPADGRAGGARPSPLPGGPLLFERHHIEEGTPYR
ncbi:hypothetical protein GCM10010112_45450 [Actinoplanes lobatus]|nr:hypothetical protein GCM10010112_45450 [Actinoplanes lobatus]